MKNPLSNPKIDKFLRKSGLDAKKLIFLILVYSVLVIYLDFTFLVKSQKAVIAKLNPKITKITDDLLDLERDRTLMGEFKKRQSFDTAKGIQKAKKLATEEGLASLLQEISDLANRNNVRIVQMRPVKGAKITGQLAYLADKFTPLAINLDLFCGYHQLGKFINALESCPTLVAVDQLKILRQDKDYFQQKVVLVLKAYVKK